ncbi:DUF2226 domain-containing protein [Candidatus Micrarchaeota archaeon]|nr:DUF2226 domain-containing protein [Candidatus Micrarchaeota archaeon]
MNISAGTPLERGKKISETNVRDYIERLMAERFDGYVSISSMGKYGLEEGTIVFHNGAFVSSDYEYCKFNKSFKSTLGLERSLNALLSKNGVLDSFSLTANQVQLILALNEEANLEAPVTKETMKIPVSFSQSYEEDLSSSLPSPEMSKEQLFKKLGLSKQPGEKTTRETLMEKAKAEDKEIITTVEKKQEDDRVKKLQDLLKR